MLSMSHVRPGQCSGHPIDMVQPAGAAREQADGRGDHLQLDPRQCNGEEMARDYQLQLGALTHSRCLSAI